MSITYCAFHDTYITYIMGYTLQRIFLPIDVITLENCLNTVGNLAYHRFARFVRVESRSIYIEHDLETTRTFVRLRKRRQPSRVQMSPVTDSISPRNVLLEFSRILDVGVEIRKHEMGLSSCDLDYAINNHRTKAN